MDEDNLEKALNNVGGEKNNCCSDGEHSCGDDCKCANDEIVGFHKGCLNTLASERNELIKIIQNVEMIMQAHLKKLEELGVKVDGENSKDSC